MGAALSHTTLIIVAVCAALAAVLAVLLALRLLRATNRRPAAPLPPIQPLAHHRILKYDCLDSRPPSSVPDSQENFPPFPNPSFHSFDSSFPPPSPVSSIPRRPLSSASLSSAGHMSRRTSRANLPGLPHAPSSQIQIILPAPLSATLPRPRSMRRDTESDRTSSVDKWISVGRDDSTFPTMPSTLRSSRRASASAIMTSPLSFTGTYYQHPFPPPPVPRIPKEMISQV